MNSILSQSSDHVPVETIDRVVLINDFSKVRGGAAALVMLLARQLAARGIKTTFITGDEGALSDQDREGVEIVALCEPPLLERKIHVALAKGLYNSAAQTMLAKWIAEHDTPRTIYHLHNWAHILSGSVFRSLQQVHRRTLLHAHDYFLACPNGAFVNYRNSEPCDLIPLSAACISTNCDKRNYIQKLWRVARNEVRQTLWDFAKYQTRVLMIHDGMTEPFLRSGFSRSQLHAVRNPSSPFTATRVEAENNREFVFVGRVDEEKGVTDFLSAAHAAGAPARVIGDGNLLPQLMKENPLAKFDGWQSHDRIAELVKSARVLVMPSRYPEPFGLVIIEALGSGIPVILPNSALLRAEVVKHNVGFSCDTRSTEQLSAIMRAAMSDDSRIETMSREAFRLKNMLAVSPDNWSEQIIGHYQTLLAA